MHTRPALLVAAFAPLLFLTGCKPPKLEENKTYAMGPGQTKALDLPSISKPQKITVEFTSSAGEISVYLLKNASENDGLGDARPDKDKTLDTKKGKSGNFSVDVPANTATRVVIRDVAQNTEVAIKLSNSK